MRIVRIAERVPHQGVIRLHHLTDLHAGAPDFAEAEFLERRALIEADPWARWTMGGDGGDLIRHSDPRYELTSLHPRYRQATDIRYTTREHLVELFQPIKDKCWGWADGNHERQLDKFYGGKFGVEVCCDLGLESRYLGYRGFAAVSVTVGQRDAHMGLLIDLQHGWQAGRLKGAFLVQAERELGMTDADVVLRGHNHQPAGRVFATLGVTHPGRGPGRVVKRMRTVINGGSWRAGYRDDLAPVDPSRLGEVEGDLWSETKGYRLEPIGGPVLILRFDQGYTSRRGYRPCGVEHTLVEGRIDAQNLGLKTT
ncbi:MAG: hypothetical protein HY323_05615 [Betaproteobacteria bacterium]|nr:hypothetical protein [Betaproteobacteria bacterium]